MAVPVQGNGVNSQWDSAERIFTNAGVSKFNPNPTIHPINPAAGRESTHPEQSGLVATPTSPKVGRASTAGRLRSNVGGSGRPTSRPATSAQRVGAHSSTKATVSYAGDTELLPTHMRSVMVLLEQNINAVRHFSSRFQQMTNSELHTAGINLSALVGSQEVCLRDLSHFTAKEVKHGKERIRDLSVQLQTEKDDVARQLHTMELLYTAVSTIAGITAAKEALLFLFPRGRGDQKEMDAIRHDSSDDAMSLNLVAHVSTDPFDSLADGSTSPDIYDICHAVAQSQCAANVNTSSAGPIRSFQSIVACPILPPGQVNAVGVLCIVNKIAAYEPQFSADDECRCIYTGEQVAQILEMFPLTVSRTVPLLVTPHSYQQLYKQWVGPNHQQSARKSQSLHHQQSLAAAKAEHKKIGVVGAVLNSSSEQFQPNGGTLAAHMREPISKKFIFRATHNGKMLDELRHVKSRLAVSPAEVLVDVLGRYKILEKQLDTTAKRLSVALLEVEKTHKEVLAAKEVARRFELQSADMQVASERILRQAYMQGRIPATESAAAKPIVCSSTTSSTAGTLDTGSDIDAVHHDRERNESSLLPATPIPPVVVDPSLLPPKFLQRAASLKSKSFFPTSGAAGALGHSARGSRRGPDPRWNGRSKLVVSGAEFLKPR